MSDALRRAILANDESRNALARRAEVPASAISRFLSGERLLDLSSVDRLARALDLKLVPRRGTSRRPGKREK